MRAAGEVSVRVPGQRSWHYQPERRETMTPLRQPVAHRTASVVARRKAKRGVVGNELAPQRWVRVSLLCDCGTQRARD
jgi:hypothetical protein